MALSETSHNSSIKCIDRVTKITADLEIQIAGRRSRPARAFEEIGVEISLNGM